MSHLWSDDNKTCCLNCRQFEGSDFLELSEAWCLVKLEDDEFSAFPIQCFLQVLIEYNAVHCRGKRDLSFEVAVSDMKKFLLKLSEKDVLYGTFWKALASIDDDYGFLKLCKELIPHMYI
jgi:hypothetical protein